MLTNGFDVNVKYAEFCVFCNNNNTTTTKKNRVNLHSIFTYNKHKSITLTMLWIALCTQFRKPLQKKYDRNMRFFFFHSFIYLFIYFLWKKNSTTRDMNYYFQHTYEIIDSVWIACAFYKYKRVRILFQQSNIVVIILSISYLIHSIHFSKATVKILTLFSAWFFCSKKRIITHKKGQQQKRTKWNFGTTE